MSPSNPDTVKINTINESALSVGTNMDNHSETMKGRGKFVKQGVAYAPIWRTRQSVYRFCAWALLLTELHDLPDEPGAHTFEQIQEAIQTEISGE